MIEAVKKYLRIYPAIKLAALCVTAIFVIHETGMYLTWNPAITLAASITLAFCGYAFLKHKIISATCWTAAVIFLIFARAGTDLSEEDHVSAFTGSGRELLITGFVCSDPVLADNKQKFFFKTDSIYFTRHLGFPACGKILVRFGPSVELKPLYGDGLKLYGALTMPSDERNPGEFNYGAYLRHRGVGGIISVGHPDKAEKTGEWNGNVFYAGLILPVKHSILDFFKEAHSPLSSAILSALILGDRSEVPEEVYQAFAQSGTVHVLALSGLHVGFILALLWGLLSFLRVPFRYRVVITIGGLWFYAGIADMTPSVVRAVVMTTVVLTGELIQRRRMLMNNLLVAMIVILFADPHSLFDIGFQLSFTAVISIVWIYPKIESLFRQTGIYKDGRNPVLNKALTLMMISIAAQIGTLPFTAYYFYRIPILATIANVFVIPLSGIVMMIGFISAWLSQFAMTAAVWYANLNEWLIYLMTAIPGWSVRLPFAYADYYGMSAGLLIVYYLVLIWISLWRYRFVRMAGIYSLLILVNITVWRNGIFRDQELTVSFLDVGQGDCAVVRSPVGEVILIDAGDKTEIYDYGESVIAPFLRKQGIERINRLIMTHPHNDHIGGMGYLLRNFNIDTVYHNGQYIRSDILDDIHRIIAERHIPQRTLCAGDMIQTGDGLSCFVISPDRRYARDTTYDNVNDGSLVMILKYGEKRFLLMGDSERNMFGHFNKYAYFIQSDVIKVSHHGAINGTTPGLVSLVQPKAAVLSVGMYNRFNHPSPLVIRMYHASGADIFRTDKTGAVVIRSDGQHIQRVR